MSTSELFDSFEANPGDHRAFDALLKELIATGDREGFEVVYEQLPTWVEDASTSPLMRLLMQKARTVEDAELSTFLHFSNGMVLWKHFEDTQKAEMCFRKIQTAPPDRDALREFYLGYYTAQKNWRRLEQYLTDPERGGMEDGPDVKRMLAGLADEHGQPERAITFWQGVAKAEPEAKDAQKALGRLYKKAGKWHSMVELLREKLKGLDEDDVDGQLKLQRDMIKIYKKHLKAPSKVISAWQAVLEIDPGNQDALDALQAEYEEMGRWPDLVKVLQQKVIHEEDPEAEIALHRRVASLMLEKFSNTAEAIKHFEAILALRPEDDEALTVLKDIYEQRRDWEHYIDVTETEIGRLDGEDARHAALVELAVLGSERIRKPGVPIGLWERVLDREPNHRDGLAQLEILYEREKAYDKLADVLDRRCAHEKDAAERVQLLERLGIVTTSRLHDAERAAEVWKRLLADDPEHLKAQTELRKRYLALKDWEGLEWFYRAYGSLGEWVRTLESQAKSAEDDSDRVALLLQAASLWRGELEEPRRAIKDLEGVLEVDPQHVEAAKALIPIYEEVQAYQKLPRVFDVVLEATTDGEARRDMLLELAVLQDERLGDVDAAFFSYVQVLRESTATPSLYGGFRDLAERSGNWETYVSVVDDLLEVMDDAAFRQSALLDLGRVYRDHVGDSQSARECLYRVVAADGTCGDALDLLLGIHREDGQWDQLLAVYDRKLRLLDDEQAQRDILLAQAEVWRDQLGEPQEAAAIFRQMLEDYPSDVRIHDALCEMYVDVGDHKALADVLARKLDVIAAAGARPEVLADIEVQLGMLTYAARTDRWRVKATVDRYEAALGHTARHHEARVRLEELLGDEGQRARIARILEGLYEAEEAWEAFGQALEIQILGARADGDVEAQLALLDRLAELYSGTLDNWDLAWRSHGRIVEIAPDREGSRQAFEALTDELDRWNRLTRLYDGVADHARESSSRLDMRLAVARVWHHRLGEPDQARTYYHAVLDEDGQHTEALEALEDIYQTLERPEDLLDVYGRKLDLTADPLQRIDLLFLISDLQRDRLDRHEDAIQAALDALDLQPGHEGAIERLDELYTRTGRWEDLTDVLEGFIDTIRDDADRAHMVTIRLAGIYESQREDVDKAMNLYAQVLNADDDHTAALGALERLFEEPAYAPTIAPILEPCYQRRGDWRRLIDIYEVRENAADDPAEQVAWHLRIADLYENKGEQAEMAFEHFALAASLEPGREKTITELLRLTDVLDNHGELVLHLQSLVDEIDDDDRRVDTHRIVAGLAREKTGDLQGAERHLCAILDIRPSDSAAIEQLIGLARHTGDAAKLVDALLRKGELGGVGGEQRSLYAEAGELASRVLDDPAKAIEIYETLHGLDPTEDIGLDALEPLYRQVEAFEELVDVYRQKIDRTAELPDRKLLAGHMAQVQAECIDAVDDAIQTWRTVLQWDPEDLGALRELDRLSGLQEDWFGQRDALVQMQGLVDELGWVQLQFRIGSLLADENRLGDVRGAIACLGALLERRVDHPETHDLLQEIIADREEREAAFEVLRPALETTGAFEVLWDQHQIMAIHLEDEPARLLETLGAMAELAEGELGDPERAFEAHARAFHADPRAERARSELRRLTETHGLWESLTELYWDGAERADDDFLSLELRLEAGRVIMDLIGAPDRAITVYERIRADHPDHLETLARLHRLYEGKGMSAELADVLRHQADAHHQPADKVPFMARLAQALEHELDQRQAAYETLLEILDLDRTSELAMSELWRLYSDGYERLDIAERLEPLYTEQEAWDQLHALLELKLDPLEDVADRIEVMRQLAELNLNQLDRRPEALIWYGRAFRLEPEDDFVLDQVTSLASAEGLWEDLRNILTDGASAVEDDGRRLELWQRAAGVVRDQLGDPIEAERIYRLILDLDPDHGDALGALDTLLTNQERWEDLEPVLVHAAKVVDFDDERVDLLVRLAELYRDRLGRRDDGVATYVQVLEISELHRPTLVALEVLYREDARWQDLFETLHQLSDTSRDPDERVGFVADMARIAEAHLDRVEDATEYWEDVLAHSPQHREAILELQRLHEQQENWDALVEAYERELRLGLDDATRRLDLTKRLGRVVQTRLDDAFRAQTYWQAAREEAPHDREALDALRITYRDGYNLEGLAGVLEAQLASGGYLDEEQREIWRELAVLYTEQLVDPAKAVSAWRQVFDMDTQDLEAFEQLERLFEAEGRWADAIELYQERVATMDDETDRVETRLHIGSIQHDRLHDVEAAATTYRRVLSQHPDQMEASSRLEAIYESTGQWESLGELLLDRTDYIEDPLDRVTNLRRLATLYEERLGQKEAAFVVLQRACGETPDDTDLLDALGRLAADAGMWRDMVRTYDACIPHLEGDDASNALLKAADLLRDRLEHPTEAVKYYSRVLENDGESERALRALVAIHRELEAWDDLADWLAALADVAPDTQEQIGFLREQAHVHEQERGDLGSAVGAWRAILEVDDFESTALAALDRLHGQRGDWDELIEILERRTQVDPSEAVAMNLRIADVLETHLERMDDAVDRYEDVLSFAPSNPDAIARLVSLHGERNDWAKLADIYERAFDATTGTDERVEIGRNIVILQREVFEDPETVIDWCHRILAIVPDDVPSLDMLETIYREQAGWDDLVGVLSLRHQRLTSPADQTEALLRMARIYRDEMGDLDQAIGSYERVMGTDPNHEEALNALEELYGAQGMWEQALEAIDRKLASCEEAGLRLELMQRQGRISAEEIGNPFDAAKYFERALEEAPGHEGVVAALLSIYTEEGRHEQVVQVLEHKLSTLTESADICRLHVRLSEVWRKELGNEDKALLHLEAAVEHNPEDDSALWPLAEHYMAEEAWTKGMPLLDVLADQLEHRPDDPRLGLVHKELARCAEALLDNERALDEYQWAVQHLPDDLEVLLGLGTQQFRVGQHGQAKATFEALLARGEDGLDNDDRIRVQLRLGECALRLGDIEQAKIQLSDVIAEQPRNVVALETVSEVLATHGDWEEAITYRKRLVEIYEDPLERFNTLLGIADMYREQLGDMAQAIHHYEAALQEGSFTKAPLLQLVQVHADGKNYEEAVRWLGRLVEGEEEPSRRALYAMSIAVMCRDEIGDVQRAIDAFETVLDHDLEKLEAFRAIDEMLTEAADWESLERSYRRMLARVDAAPEGLEKGPALLFTLHKNLGEIYRSRLEDRGRAAVAFEKAAKARPDDGAVREILAGMYDEAGDRPELAADHHRALIRIEPTRFDSYHRLFDLHRGMGDVEQAWGCAGLLVALDQADETEKGFYKERVSPALSEPTGPLVEDGWSGGLSSPGEDDDLGHAFALLHSALAGQLQVKTLKDFGLKKKDLLDLDRKTLVATTLRTVSDMLAIPLPDVYRDDARSGIRVLPTQPPVLSVGGDMMSGQTEKQLAFQIAKRLTYFRPTRVMAALYGPEQLELVFLAAADLVGRPAASMMRDDLDDQTSQALHGQIDQIRQELERAGISPGDRETLAGLVHSYLEAHGRPRIAAWHRHVELTANHAGLYVTGDISLTAHMIKTEEEGTSDLGRGDKLKDLVQYVISDRYVSLRKRMGLDLGSAEGATP